MSENVVLGDFHRRADASVLPEVDVAAADARAADVDEDVAGGDLEVGGDGGGAGRGVDAVFGGGGGVEGDVGLEVLEGCCGGHFVCFLRYVVRVGYAVWLEKRRNK